MLQEQMQQSNIDSGKLGKRCQHFVADQMKAAGPRSKCYGFLQPHCLEASQFDLKQFDLKQMCPVLSSNKQTFTLGIPGDAV